MSWVLTVWYLSSAGASPDVDDRVSEEGADGEGMVAAREADLGLDRIDNGDGTWSYAGPAEPPPERGVGGVTFRYDGQERFADAPLPNVGEVTWVEPDYVLTGLEYDPLAYLDFRTVHARC